MPATNFPEWEPIPLELPLEDPRRIRQLPEVIEIPEETADTPRVIVIDLD